MERDFRDGGKAFEVSHCFYPVIRDPESIPLTTLDSDEHKEPHEPNELYGLHQPNELYEPYEPHEPKEPNKPPKRGEVIWL